MVCKVDGIENVFAVGDCALTEEWDLAFYAEKQALHCADNIKRLNANKALRPYNPHGAAMFVTLGPRAGAAQVPTGKVHFKIRNRVITNRGGTKLTQSR